ncbi:adenosylmethionine decarboxylase [Endozoicomonas sp. ISHI1]|uniref:adenosylmethionine decarboxylase n=1 Tax=Endozoicomonas sp. ISHI1 TaxID=2825882 RepID=UPI0021480DAD|nr:adenosylmethionine decarboxylase [Endozoicomonas sp. ISHI1]
MNISRSGSGATLLSAIYAFSCYAFSSGGSTVGSIYKEVSSCSELTRNIDRDVCSRHLPVFKALIREKNHQVSPSTSYSMSEPIPETVKIIKISATTQKLGYEIFETIQPTLFIFDAERSPGKGQAAVYELPSEFISGDRRRINSFHLPDNSAFVGNRADILPEFVIERSPQNHFVMSAPHNDSVYYLANIEIDSRYPLDTSGSTAKATSEQPDTTSTTQHHRPTGIMDLRGAGIFVADNVRVVTDPFSSSPALIPDADDTDAPVINNAEKTGLKSLKELDNLTTWEKVGVGAGLTMLDQVITRTWFHLSNRIKQAWLRHTSQVLAAALGLGLPAFHLLPKCISGLRGRSEHPPSGRTPLEGAGLPGRSSDLYQPGNLIATSSVTQGSVAELAFSIAQDERWPTHGQTSIATDEDQLDHFITRDGVVFAGTHLLLDFWGAEKLDDPTTMEEAMRDAVEKAGATLLHIHLHRFEPNGGISGVAVLAESHISVHTWPERNFAAFDIFVCGDSQPELAVPVLKAAFNPDSVYTKEHLRGAVFSESE